MPHLVVASADEGTAGALLLQDSSMRCSCGWQGSGLLSIQRQDGETIHHVCPQCQAELQADISEWEE